MKNNNFPTKKTCPACGEEFETLNKRQLYCIGDKCKNAYHTRKNKEEKERVARTMDELTAELNQHKARPHTPPPPPGTITKQWQILDQPYQTLLLEYGQKEQEKEEIDRQIRQLTGPGPGLLWGVGIGIFLALIPISLYYEARRRKGLGMTFWVISLGGLGLMGASGGVLGGWVRNSLRTEAEEQQLADQLDKQQAKRAEISQWLQSAEQRLATLASARDKVAKYGPPSTTPPDEEAWAKPS
ncbi:hypothetical protein [Spirosoma utsteinense]|uniref:Uncharacterized protein n=1 Tax=Spirosoma utsteinense TaxID=2585773 RepID=A0ABR6WDS9_9BACT|nr:hypothetical protein [Spirosoma utsteinense]MBC3788481.1 hypothetical protein [Spirosoma utsteinense]MBC3794449.1 hypothetical protein [Spirosoma utsteinense]